MPDPLLRRALLGNAAFSASCGLALILFAPSFSTAFEVPTALVLALGVGLVPFAGVVAWVARDRHPTAVRSVIGADLAWVAIAGAVLVVFGTSMAGVAVASLTVVTLVVADFAALQWWGLRREATATRVTRPAPGPSA